MSITIPCPHCKQSLTVPEKYMGKRARCPYCNHSLTLPEQPASPNPPWPPSASPSSSSSPGIGGAGSSGGMPAPGFRGSPTGGQAGRPQGGSIQDSAVDVQVFESAAGPAYSPPPPPQSSGYTGPGSSPGSGYTRSGPPPGPAGPPPPGPPSIPPPRKSHRLGLTSGSTNASMLWSGLIAVAASILFYIVFGAIYAVSTTVAQNAFGEYLGGLFVARGWVPFAIIFLSFWSLAILFLKWRKIVKQKSALLIDSLPESIGHDITTENALRFEEHAKRIEASTGGGFFVSRVRRALEHFRAGHSGQEVASLLTSQAEIDASSVQSSYRMVKVFIWAIPILGFIGTVVGIGAAVSSFSTGIGGAEDLELIKTSLGQVTSGLAVAFDTTLVALVMSIFIMIPASSLQKSEEDYLNTVDEFCNEHLLKRLKEPSLGGAGGEQIQQAVREAVSEHAASLDAWKRELEGIAPLIGEQIAASWRTAQEKSIQDHRSLMKDVQGVLRAAGEERRDFMEQVREVQSGQIQQLDRVLSRMGESAGALQEKIEGLQESQVASFQDVVARLAGQLEGLQKQSHEQHQQEAESLKEVSQQLIEAMDSIQERAEKMQDTLAQNVAAAMSDIRVELAKVGGEAGKVFREQMIPLQKAQQSIERSAARAAEHFEQIRPVHNQAVSDIREALQGSLEGMNEMLTLKMNEPLSRLQKISADLGEHFQESLEQIIETRRAVQEMHKKTAASLEEASLALRESSREHSASVSAAAERLADSLALGAGNGHPDDAAGELAEPDTRF